MIVFISGGCKNGKSTIAENIAVSLSKKSNSQLYYIATMISHDKEDDLRIKRHIEARKDKAFSTIEEGLFVAEISKKYENGTFLLDSVTAYLSNRMFLKDKIDKSCEQEILKELLSLAENAENTVFVSDFIYSDAEEYEELTEIYRKNLAYVDKGLAKKADLVLEVSNSEVTLHKGELWIG